MSVLGAASKEWADSLSSCQLHHHTVVTNQVSMYNVTDEHNKNGITQEMGNFAEQKTTLVHLVSE